MDLQALYLRSRFWISDFLKGSPVRKQYNDIKYIDRHTDERCAPLIGQKLHKLLEYAQTHTDFYSRFDSFELRDYPVMNKLSLIQNMERIRVAPEKIPGQKGEVHIQRTSGSTGVPLAIPQDTAKRQRRIAELKYYGKAVGFTTHEKLVHLRSWNKWQNKTSRQIRLENIIPFDISKFGPEELENLYRLLVEEKVVCIRGYATTISNLAAYVRNSPGKWVFPHLKIVIAGGEALYDDVRQILKNYDIISQWQFVQLQEKKYELRLTLKSDSAGQMADLAAGLRNILGQDAELEIKKVRDIPVLSSGKRKPVMNEWKKN